MALTARQDYRSHLTMASKDLGVKHIRGHGLLDDDMSVSLAAGKSSFYNIDSLVDFLLSIGMKPIFELSFMPSWLAIEPNKTICHYKGITSPPKNYSLWGNLIHDLGAHMVSRYGEETASQFYFEVWNEPNDAFWGGGQQGYWQLYSEAAFGLKKASSKLRVGGPATCCPDCWLSDFVDFCTEHKVPYDFVSSHAYSSCGNDGLGDVGKVVRLVGQHES